MMMKGIKQQLMQENNSWLFNGTNVCKRLSELIEKRLGDEKSVVENLDNRYNIEKKTNMDY